MIDEEIKIVGVARSDDNNEVLYVASDPKASYSLVADPDDSSYRGRFPASAGLPCYVGVLEPGDVL